MNERKETWQMCVCVREREREGLGERYRGGREKECAYVRRVHTPKINSTHLE